MGEELRYMYSLLCCFVDCSVIHVVYVLLTNTGGESAVKLLSKFGLLEAAIEYATENQ